MICLLLFFSDASKQNDHKLLSLLSVILFGKLEIGSVFHVSLGIRLNHDALPSLLLLPKHLRMEKLFMTDKL